ncbi:MAG: mannitol-1-phosphate 5-dehydrogenase [Sphaerochaetaceae bacterium]
MDRLVQWGAGNIGRSFIGQIFARNGYEVVFIDIDTKLVDALNSQGAYHLRVVSPAGQTQLEVQGVRAVNGREPQRVIEEITATDLICLSLGKQVLARIAALFAEALVKRNQVRPGVPIDVIIAENMHDGAQTLRAMLKAYLPADFPLDTGVGFVETSIGKMVPIQTGTDPLEMVAEPFNTLIVDRDGFKGKIPAFAEIQAVTPIKAYVDRKLYIHNMGHAAAAYIGFKEFPALHLIAEAIHEKKVLAVVKSAMEESRDLLLMEYPQVFTRESLDVYIGDLLERFGNLALGDTVYRVGRDLKRKLRYDDRLMGAMLLASRDSLPFHHIAQAYRAALAFKATDEHGQLFVDDVLFHQSIQGKVLLEQVSLASGLSIEGLPAGIIEMFRGD